MIEHQVLRVYELAEKFKLSWLVVWSVCCRFFVEIIPLGSSKLRIVEVVWIIRFILLPPKKDNDNPKRNEVVFLFGVFAEVSYKPLLGN